MLLLFVNVFSLSQLTSTIPYLIGFSRISQGSLMKFKLDNIPDLHPQFCGLTPTILVASE